PLPPAMLSALLLLGGLAPALAHWHERHPECGGRAQSPIDIATARAQHDPSLPPLLPEGYEHPESPQLTLANNGHTAVLALPPSLRLRGLPSAFAAVQLHFHWGRPGHAAGAEHLLDGHRAPAEVPWVPGNSSKNGAAQPHPGGLAVLASATQVRRGKGGNPKSPSQHAPNCSPPTGQTVAIPSFSIRELLPEHLERYYRYNGSLTTPPCSQSVLWSLLPQPVRISRAQVGAALRGTPRLWRTQCCPLPFPSSEMSFEANLFHDSMALHPKRELLLDYARLILLFLGFLTFIFKSPKC
uniref:Carbonic anhydrase 14 n=1 Tax=Serinus canaria TaxID=9135 RepID=A0A8C9UEQ6_SERCA